ncbi:hypothetical protein GGF43_005404, partial [Coemansia sp. RSA 2618]
MDRILKIVMVGAAGSGKTSLRNYFLHRNYTWQCAPTTNPDFVSTSTPLGERGDVAMQVWDTGGDSVVTESLAQDADGLVLVFDTTRGRRELDPWLAALKVPAVLVRAKADQPMDRALWTREGIVCLEASAQTGDGVDCVFQTIAGLCIDQWRGEAIGMRKRMSRHGDPIPYHSFEFDEMPLAKRRTNARLRAM